MTTSSSLRSKWSLTPVDIPGQKSRRKFSSSCFMRKVVAACAHESVEVVLGSLDFTLKAFIRTTSK
jgi:hypothetical protein